ncbi:hypothetical protein [Microcoleus sp. B5-D4]
MAGTTFEILGQKEREAKLSGRGSPQKERSPSQTNYPSSSDFTGRG